MVGKAGKKILFRRKKTEFWVSLENMASLLLGRSPKHQEAHNYNSRALGLECGPRPIPNTERVFQVSAVIERDAM